MTLPNPEQAFIDPVKLTEYCLSSTHPVGRHEAAVFRTVLGLTALEAPQLMALLLQGVKAEPATSGRADEFGQRYQVDIPVTTEKGNGVVRTAWIVRTDESFARLVTCYLL